MKNLVTFWGWTNADQTYKKLIESAPGDWKVYQVAYEQLMPHGNVAAFKENFLKFLKENNLEKFSLMGHSLGGALALNFACQFPGKIQHLYLIDSEGVYEKQAVLKVLLGTFKKHPKYASESHHAWATAFRTVMYPVLHARLSHHAHYVDLQTEASQLKVPTTIIWGEDDVVTPINQGKKLHEVIVGSKFISIKDEGHEWILYNPQLFWENI